METSTKTLILKELTNAIIDGKFPDQTLPGENDLCDIFKVSRSTIRSVLDVLSARNIIEKNAKKKATILDIEKWDWFDPLTLDLLQQKLDKLMILEHITFLRLTFEPQACALCALNSNMKDLNDIYNVFALMEKAVKEDNINLYNKSDINFHSAIFKGAHNPFFMKLNDLFINTSIISIATTSNDSKDQLEIAITEHKQVIEAIRVKDPTLAQEAMKKIIVHAANKIFKDNKPKFLSFFNIKEDIYNDS